MKSNFQKYYLKKLTQYTHDVKCELRHYLFKLNDNSFLYVKGLTDKEVIQEKKKAINCLFLRSLKTRI